LDTTSTPRYGGTGCQTWRPDIPWFNGTYGQGRKVRDVNGIEHSSDLDVDLAGLGWDVPYRCAQQLTELIPGARLVTLDSVNHLLTAHEPAWQVFLDEVHRFLQDSAVIRPAFTGTDLVLLRSGVDDPDTGL
jgi:hypothetical protein